MSLGAWQGAGPYRAARAAVLGYMYLTLRLFIRYTRRLFGLPNSPYLAQVAEE